jgi:hypothetical protein
MLLDYRRTNHHHMSFRNPTPEGQEAKPMDQTHVSLLPGVNEVPDSHWAELKKNRVVQGMVKAKAIVELTPDALESTEDAVELVKNCVDEKLLAKFSEDERPEVSKAASKQIASLDLSNQNTADADEE